MEMKKAEKLTELFFGFRWPEKDIAFEKKCGYFGEWVERINSGHVEQYMDENSVIAWKLAQEAYDGD